MHMNADYAYRQRLYEHNVASGQYYHVLWRSDCGAQVRSGLIILKGLTEISSL
jgi:hypothetical protein